MSHKFLMDHLICKIKLCYTLYVVDARSARKKPRNDQPLYRSPSFSPKLTNRPRNWTLGGVGTPHISFVVSSAVREIPSWIRGSPSQLICLPRPRQRFLLARYVWNLRICPRNELGWERGVPRRLLFLTCTLQWSFGEWVWAHFWYSFLFNFSVFRTRGFR